jgi:single-stranded DNA-binding protein
VSLDLPLCPGWRDLAGRWWHADHQPQAVWRDQAEHAAESLSKGSCVVVVGRLRQRTRTAEDGSARQAVEVVAEELGPSLRWATRSS